MPTTTTTSWYLIAVLLVSTCVGGCGSVGPRTVPQDQFNYNGAIADAAHEQILLNLIRLRYAEMPMFLRVSSVIAQYSRVAQLNASVGAGNAPSGDTNASGALGGGVVWADRPTITYIPVSGQEFSRNLLKPLRPEALFEMIMAGWSTDLVFRIALWSINDLDNAVARPPHRRAIDPKLIELLEVWPRLRQAGALGMRKVPTSDGRSELMLFLFDQDASPEVARDIARFRELLEIEPTVGELHLAYGLRPAESDQIAVLTGSVYDIMLDLAWQLDVPEEHVKTGRAGETAQLRGASERPPIDVRSSAEEPRNAFVAVRAQDHWFYIDQNDRESKRAFTFLQLLLSLADTDTPPAGPIVTITN